MRRPICKAQVNEETRRGSATLSSRANGNTADRSRNSFACGAPVKEVITMLRWAVILFVVSIVAAVFGFAGVASAAAGIAKVLFFLFLAVAIIMLIAGITGHRTHHPTHDPSHHH